MDAILDFSCSSTRAFAGSAAPLELKAVWKAGLLDLLVVSSALVTARAFLDPSTTKSASISLLGTILGSFASLQAFESNILTLNFFYLVVLRE